MKRTGWLALAVALSLAIAACSSSGSRGSGGLGGSSTTNGTTDACKGKTLEASETGVTATDIKVTVMADVGSPLRPGLFQGSVDGVNAWAQYVNANGGLACRDVTVVEADSKLSPDEAKNGVTAACGSSVVLLGTTALFLNDMRPAEGCKDKAGAATGIPDLPVLQTEPVEQCSKISFAVIPNGGSCPYSGKGVRSFQSVTPAIEWFKKNVTTDLHGIFVVPADLPSTITSSTPLFTAIQNDGVKQDAEFGASGLWTQSQYTPVVQAIKAKKATYVQNGLDYAGHVEDAQGGKAQGVSSVKVWACSLQCYNPNFITEGKDGRRQAVLVAAVPAVRGQGLERHARRVPAVRQEARQLRSAGVLGRTAVPAGRRGHRRQGRPERDHAQGHPRRDRDGARLRCRRPAREDRHRRQEPEPVHRHRAGEARRVGARRPGEEGHVRLRPAGGDWASLTRPAEGVQAELMSDGLPDR